MEKYLRRCLDSLIIDEEGMKQLEVLVINDGSKDSSSQIAHEYQDKYPDTFRVIDKENGNYGSCVNRGLNEARGKYIKVLDADDWFDMPNFSHFLSLLSSVDSDLIVTDYNIVNIEGKVTRKWKFGFPRHQELQVRNYCSTSSFTNLEMHAITFKASLLIDNHYKQTEGISYTDQEWMFIPLIYVESFQYFNISLYQYVLGREGQTMDPKVKIKAIDQLNKILFREINVINQKNISKEKYQYLLARLLRNANNIFSLLLLINDYDKLKVIDRQIHDVNPQIYNMMNDMLLDKKYWPFKYVEYWRNDNKFKLYIVLKGYALLLWFKNIMR